jgi:hypothetical protein
LHEPGGESYSDPVFVRIAYREEHPRRENDIRDDDPETQVNHELESRGKLFANLHAEKVGKVGLQSTGPGIALILGGVVLIGVSLYKPVAYSEHAIPAVGTSESAP